MQYHAGNDLLHRHRFQEPRTLGRDTWPDRHATRQFPRIKHDHHHQGACGTPLRSSHHRLAAYSFATPITPGSIKREISVEILMSPNSLTVTPLIARSDVGTVTTGSRARSHAQKKRPNDC